MLLDKTLIGYVSGFFAPAVPGLGLHFRTGSRARAAAKVFILTHPPDFQLADFFCLIPDFLRSKSRPPSSPQDSLKGKGTKWRTSAHPPD